MKLESPVTSAMINHVRSIDGPSRAIGLTSDLALHYQQELKIGFKAGAYLVNKFAAKEIQTLS